MKGFGDHARSKKKKVSDKRTQTSKEQVINQAIKLHLEGNIKEASKYYQQIINQGFRDFRVFSRLRPIYCVRGKYHRND